MPVLLRCVRASLVILAFLGVAGGAAALTPDQVLLIYNDPGNHGVSDGYHIQEHYRQERPGVRLLNLDDATLGPGAVTYAVFVEKIREPLRAYLRAQGWEDVIRVFLLTKGIPHQIDDINLPGLGNGGGGILPAFRTHNATFASVDSELTLLWHDLDAGEAGGEGDSLADNFILNPFFQWKTPLPRHPSLAAPQDVDFSIATIVDPERPDAAYRLWKMQPDDPGLLYLTARLDGHRLEDVLNMIDRARNIVLDAKRYLAVLDGNEGALDAQGLLDNDPLTPDVSSMDRAAVWLEDRGWARVIHDRGSLFHMGARQEAFVGSVASAQRVVLRDPVIFLASWGANHFAAVEEAGWARTFAGQLPHGAILNTFESYNGRALGGVAPYRDQAQVADWFADGGTLALGHVWEPLGLAVGWNVALLDRFFGGGATWVEAAWASLPVLSWQNVVLGDPLARAIWKSDVPQLRLVLPSPSLESRLEGDTPRYEVVLESDLAPGTDLEVRLRLDGMSIPADGTLTGLEADHRGGWRLHLPAGQQQTSFFFQVQDDAEAEGLEMLRIALTESSHDTNGDGFGEGYGFAQEEVTLAVADGPYEAWQYLHFGGLEVALSDHDGDGLTALWEYFLGSDPRVPHPRGRVDPLMPLEIHMPGPQGFLCHLPSSFPADVRLILETTSALGAEPWRPAAWRQGNGSWEHGSEVSLASVPVDTGRERLSITFTGVNPRSFFRFRVTAVPSP